MIRVVELESAMVFRWPSAYIKHSMTVYRPLQICPHLISLLNPVPILMVLTKALSSIWS